MNTSIASSENDLTLIRQLIREELRNELRAAQSAGDNGASLLEADAVTDRRSMLKTVAGLAMGVATVGLLRPSSSSGASYSKQGSSPDATGGNMIIGNQNFVTNTTDITALTGTSSTILIDTLFLATNYGTTNFVPFGDKIASAAYINNGGTATADTLIALYGEARRPAGGFAYGVYALSDDVGVFGQGDNNGCGVDGFIPAGGTTDAFGVRGTSTPGAGGAFSGGRAALALGVGTGVVANPNTSNPSGASVGDVYRSSAAAGAVGDGGFWCRTGAAGSYRRVADQTTVGALSAFPAPPVIINTLTGMGGGLLAAGAVATYQITGVTVNGFTVPAGARSIIARIANPAEAGTSGSILVAATNPPPAGTGIIGLAQSQIQNQFFSSALDSTGKLYVKNGTNGSTHIIIAVGGYYL